MSPGRPEVVDICLTRWQGQVELTALSADGAHTTERLTPQECLERVAALDAGPDPVRWVLPEARTHYPPLLDGGVRLRRCLDLRLSRAILRGASATSASALAAAPASRWDQVPVAATAGALDQPTLLEDPGGLHEMPTEEVLAEHRRQQDAVAGADRAGALRLLLAAESAGGLTAAEMRHVGMPFDVAVHDRLLTGLLGPRPRAGERPAQLESLVGRIRELLESPRLNPDSAASLLRALRAAGLDVSSTRQWELQALSHPAIPVVLEYKKLSRLLTANGWQWMDTWVRDGRFHPDYLPGGVVTGRWAAQGGGALQLPHRVRAAVTADPGWRLVVADASQLEPRVLAAMSGDTAMARASRGSDLYAALVDQGVVATRPQAKVAMLGALYGATTGEAGLLMPALMRAYPRATGLVEHAAREGELGHQVSTWLGRTSPAPGEGWRQVQQRASTVEAGVADERAARSQARDWGRFTRNFVVQGSAAEWALCWLAAIRRDLGQLVPAGDPARPDLVYFLHDEVIVHTPADLAEQVADIVRGAAAEAGRLLFGPSDAEHGVDFPVVLSTVSTYDEAH